MSSLVRRWGLGLCLLVLSVLTGCDKTEELERAVRRAEKAEKVASSLKLAQTELIANKKELELQILLLQQPQGADVNDLLPHDIPLGEVVDGQGQAMELLRQQLEQARVELKEKDEDIQELQNLVEALTETVNQLQAQYDEEAILEGEGLQDPNLLGGDTQV